MQTATAAPLRCPSADQLIPTQLTGPEIDTREAPTVSGNVVTTQTKKNKLKISLRSVIRTDIIASNDQKTTQRQGAADLHARAAKFSLGGLGATQHCAECQQQCGAWQQHSLKLGSPCNAKMNAGDLTQLSHCATQTLGTYHRCANTHFPNMRYSSGTATTRRSTL
jgi:hypothetical protein